MTKIFSPPDDIKKKRVSVRMHKEMHKAILACLMDHGISSRAISSWVSEAIVQLQTDASFCDIIAEEWFDKGNSVARPITLSAQAADALEKINANVRCRLKTGPDINSKIIRTAITQKLIKEEEVGMKM